MMAWWADRWREMEAGGIVVPSRAALANSRSVNS
jgi:hypothetical protein